MRAGRRDRRRRLGAARLGRAVPLLAGVAAALALAACGASTPTAARRAGSTARPRATTTTAPGATTTTVAVPGTAPTATTTSTTAAAAPTTTDAAPPSQQALRAAITAFQSSQGVPAADYRVGTVVESTVDPSWVKFTVAATPAAAGNYQGGYGFVHQSGGTWSVTSFGTAEVGCGGTGAVPAPVLSGFGASCPTGG